MILTFIQKCMKCIIPCACGATNQEIHNMYNVLTIFIEMKLNKMQKKHIPHSTVLDIKLQFRER